MTIKSVIVDREAEAGYKRRALRRMPLEYMELMVGYINQDVAHICAFVPVPHTATPETIVYDDEEIDERTEEVRAMRMGGIKLLVLGSIHSHPNRTETIFSETDLRDHLRCPRDLVMAICAIELKQVGEKVRRKCHIAYWPGVLPLATEYTRWRGEGSEPTPVQVKESLLEDAA